MNFITRHFSSILRLACAVMFATPLYIYAQEDDGLVHDVLTPQTIFQTAPTNPSKIRSYSYAGQAATYIGMSAVTYFDDYFSYPYQSSNRTYLAANSSNGFICRSISISASIANKARFDVYGSNSTYEASDLEKGNNLGTLIGSISTNNGSISLTEGANAFANICILSENGINTLYSIDFAFQRAYSRTDLSANSLGTICLPYAVKKEDLSGITPYSIVGKKLDTDGTPKQIVFGEVEEMEAGMPYVFIASEPNFTLPLAGSTPVATAGSYNGLVGTFTDHAFADDADYDDNYYVISTSNRVQAASSKSGVKANRAYIRMDQVPTLADTYNPASSALRTLILADDGFEVVNGTTTSLVNASTAVTHAATYSLNGRPIDRNTSSLGISIVAGRKKISINQH